MLSVCYILSDTLFSHIQSRRKKASWQAVI